MTVRTVLFGYGLAGKVFHGPLISAVPGLELAAIVTTNPERQEAAHADFPDARVVSAEQVWAGEIPDIQLAVVAGANPTHVPFTLAALERAWHVVVDKPVAATAADVEELAHAARHAQRVVIPFQNRRWDSDFLTMLALRDNERIGSIHRFESRFGSFKPAPRGTWRESAEPELLGGMLYDLGAHLVDQAIRLLGPITSITTHARHVRTAENLADDDVVFITHHASGAVGYLVGSISAADHAPRMLTLGTRGSARVDITDQQEAALKAGIPVDAIGPQNHQMELRTVVDGDVVTTSEDLLPGRWADFYPAVYRSITEGTQPPVMIDDVVQTMRVLDAARESAASHGTVFLDPPAGHSY